MNFLTYAILLAALLLGCLAATGVHAAEGGNDTYNFYFQKAPGPVTVNQGSAPSDPKITFAPQPAPAAPTQQTVAAAPKEEESSVKRFYLTPLYALASPYATTSAYDIATGAKDQYFGGQIGLRAEYDVTERVSLMGGIYKLAKPITINRLKYDVRDPRLTQVPWEREEKGNPEVAKNVFDFSLGAAAHLLKLRSTTFSFLGGVVTVPKLHYEDVSRGVFSGISEAKEGIQHAKTFYTGARLRLVADNVWGIDASYRAILGANIGVAEFGLTVVL